MLRFDVMTLFPEYFETLKLSIIGKGIDKGLLRVYTHNIRENSENKHKKTDDYPYGGGQGMVMTVQPIYSTYLKILDEIDTNEKTTVLYMSPKGKVFNQDTAKRLVGYDNIILLCGHYEGVDQRIIDEIVDEEISIGDYVLTGGEIPALVLIDAVGRLIPGVLSEEEGFIDESHYNGLLEYPQYTRPETVINRTVPDVLLSGHHKNIGKWRYYNSLLLTERNRPDLFERLQLTDEVLEQYERFKEGMLKKKNDLD